MLCLLWTIFGVLHINVVAVVDNIWCSLHQHCSRCEQYPMFLLQKLCSIFMCSWHQDETFQSSICNIFVFGKLESLTILWWPWMWDEYWYWILILVPVAIKQGNERKSQDSSRDRIRIWIDKKSKQMYFYDDFKNCLFSLDPDLEIEEKDPIQQILKLWLSQDFSVGWAMCELSTNNQIS